MVDVLAWSMFEVPQEISLADTVDVSPRSMYVKCTHTHITYIHTYVTKCIRIIQITFLTLVYFLLLRIE